MRWNKKEPPCVGNSRLRSRFLFLPKCVAGQWRWLEFAVWEEVFNRRNDWIEGWLAERWMDSHKKEVQSNE